VDILMNGMLIASLFVLGGNFWDKLRSLFFVDARVVFPAEGKATANVLPPKTLKTASGGPRLVRDSRPEDPKDASPLTARPCSSAAIGEVLVNTKGRSVGGEILDRGSAHPIRHLVH